jgi:hypothetical protein
MFKHLFSSHRPTTLADPRDVITVRRGPAPMPRIRYY